MMDKCYIDGCPEPVCTYIDVDGGYTVTCLVHAVSDYSRSISEEAMTIAAYHYMQRSLELKEELRAAKSQLWMWPN